MVIVINLLISYQIIHTKSKVRFSIYSSRANSDADRYKPREFASVHGLRLSSLALMPGQWVWETPPCGGVDLSHESQKDYIITIRSKLLPSSKISDNGFYRIFSSRKLGKNEKQNEKQYYENYYQFNCVPQTPPAARLLEIVRVGSVRV